MRHTFTKNLLSSCIATLALSSLSTSLQAQDDKNAVEEVIVMGVRASIEKSIDVKRNSASIVDVITAEDIGKLPDTTIVDSLQRVPGVQIQRSAGEGSRVNIRGSSNVAMMLNGEQFLSAGNINGVQPDLTDIPSTMVSAIEVLKTTTASTLTGGLSGTIDLQTHEPLKLKDGLTINGQLNTAQGSRTKTNDYGGEVFAGFHGETWGAALNASYSDVTLGDDLSGSNGDEGAGWWGMPSEQSTSAQHDFNSNGVIDKYIQIEGFQAAQRVNQRKRFALNSSFDVELNEAFTLSADVFYTDMDQSRRQRSFRVDGGWDWNWNNPVFANKRVAPAGATYGDFYSVQEYNLNITKAIPNSNENLEKRESTNTNLELKFDNGGPLTGSIRYVHGEASSDTTSFEVDAYMSDGSQCNCYSDFADGTKGLTNPGGYGANTPPLGADGKPLLDAQGNPVKDGSGNVRNAIIGKVKYTGSGLEFTLPAALGKDLSQYGMVSNHMLGQTGEATLDVFRLDGSYKTDLGILTSIDFGLRQSEREVDYKSWYNVALMKNANGQAYGMRWKDADGNAPITNETSFFNIKFTDPRLSPYVVKESNFPGITGVNPMYFIDTSKLDGRSFTNMIFPENFDYADPGQSYKVNEQTQTIFTQFNLAGDLASMPYSGNVGVRYIRTELETLSHETEPSVNGVSTYNYNGTDYLMGSGWENLDRGTMLTPNNYNDVLPSLNLALDVADDHKVRFSYNKMMTMHDLGNLGRGLSVSRLHDTANNVFIVNTASQSGNPLLKPQRATNVDLSYEWYFTEGGLVSAAAFYRENETALKNGVYLRSDLKDSDGQIRNKAVRTTYLTTIKGGQSKGFELAYQQSLTFLPGFWRDFGVSANYTYSPSEGSETGFNGDALPEGNNSKHQTNLVLWYENDKFNARLAHNYRSKRLEWVADVWGTPLGVWATPTQDLSFSMGYKFNDMATVRFDAVNLLEETTTRYLEWTDQVDKHLYTERRLNLTLQLRY